MSTGLLAQTGLLLPAACLVLGGAILAWPNRRTAPAASPARGRALRPLAVCAVVTTGLLFAGLAGLLASIALAPGAWWAVGRLQARVVVAPEPELPLALDLIAAALRAGSPPSVAITAVAPAAGAYADRLAHTGALLALGAEADQAWWGLRGDPWLAGFAISAVRSSASGIALADTCERAAAAVRAEAHAAAGRSASRAGVLGILPLGLCFLPAFVCLGVVPVIIGISHGIGTGLR